jgi:prepilin-type N-terminal cleavage/methylation domain-containing protein
MLTLQAENDSPECTTSDQSWKGIAIRGFSLVEVLVVVVILGILAAVVVPRFAGATDQARTTAAESSLASVRGAIAAFRTRAVIAGSDPYPSLSDLETVGSVLHAELPANPWTGIRGVREVTALQAQERIVIGPNEYGWCYFVDNESMPPQSVFYANSESPTQRRDQAGVVILANQL